MSSSGRAVGSSRCAATDSAHCRRSSPGHSADVGQGQPGHVGVPHDPVALSRDAFDLPKGKNGDGSAWARTGLLDDVTTRV